MVKKVSYILGTLIGASMAEKPIALFIMSGHPVFGIVWVIAVVIERK